MEVAEQLLQGLQRRQRVCVGARSRGDTRRVEEYPEATYILP